MIVSDLLARFSIIYSYQGMDYHSSAECGE